LLVYVLKQTVDLRNPYLIAGPCMKLMHIRLSVGVYYC